MTRTLSLIILSFAFLSPLRAADAMHVPLLVKYHQESHFTAGFLTGMGTDYLLTKCGVENKPIRFASSVGFALGLGTAKEYLIDKHPRNKEIGPWGIGAAVGVSIRWAF